MGTEQPWGGVYTRATRSTGKKKEKKKKVHPLISLDEPKNRGVARLLTRLSSPLCGYAQTRDFEAQGKKPELEGPFPILFPRIGLLYMTSRRPELASILLTRGRRSHLMGEFAEAEAAAPCRPVCATNTGSIYLCFLNSRGKK